MRAPTPRTLVFCGVLVAAVSRAARASCLSLLVACLFLLTASGANAQANDAFANATELPLATVLTGTNSGATKEVDEPDHGNNAGGGSVWWKFTPTVSKTFVLDLAGTDFRATAGIYTGNSVGNLTAVASWSNPPRPFIPFSATANTTYYIAVDGYNDSTNPHETGSITIRINRRLIVTPETNAEFRGPPGGPFTPSSFTYTLTAPAGPIDVTIFNSSSWGDESEDQIDDLHTTPVEITLTPNANANGRTPGSYGAQLQFALPSGPGSEIRNIFLLVSDPSNHTISLSANPAAGGTVTGGGTFAHGSSRTVNATPKPGYEFVNWTEGANTVAVTRSYTFTLNADRTLRANFRRKNDLLSDFGASGLFQRMNNMTWVKVHNSNPLAIAAGDLDGNGKDEAIVSVAGSGIFARYNNAGSWVRKNTAVAVRLAAGDLDGNGRDELIVDRGSAGLWVFRNNANWAQLRAWVVQGLAVGDFDGNRREDVAIDFGTRGLWVLLNNATWQQLYAGNPVYIAAGDLDGNGKDELIADRGTGTAGGIFVRANNAGAWRKIRNGAVTQGLETGDLDGNGKDELLVDLGSTGFYALFNNTTNWVRLHTGSPTFFTTADLDSSGRADVVAGFGTSGLYARYNNTTVWTRISTAQTQGLAAGGFD